MRLYTIYTFYTAIFVLLEQGVVDEADDFAGLLGNFLLAANGLGAGVREELEAVEFLREVFEEERLGFGVRLLHVVNEEFREVAGHDPAWVARERKIDDVALRLLVGGEKRAVGLLDCGAEILAEGLLLDHNPRGGDVAVDETVGGVDVRLVLELDEALVGVVDAQDAQKPDPEGLCLALLIALASPKRDELAGG